MSRLLDRIKILWAIYRPVRGLFAVYVFAVLVGALVEGLTLMAIVPLIGTEVGRISEFFDSMLELLGLSSSDQNLIILVGILVVLRAFTKYASTLLAGLMVRREAVRLQVDLFRAYLGADWEVVVGVPQGEIQHLLGGQTQRAADFLGQSVQLVEALVFVVGLTAAALVVSPDDTLLAIGLIGVTGLAVTAISNRIQRHAEAVLKETKSQSNLLMQFARGSTVLRSFGVTEYAVGQVEERASRREKMNYRSERAAALAVALPDLLFVLALLGVVAVSFSSGEGVAEVTAVIALLYRIANYLKRLSGLTALRERIPDLRDVHRMQKLFTEGSSGRTARLVDQTLEAGSIELRDISHRFSGADHVALKGVTNSIQPGEFIGLVGSSGSGKSTLVHVVVGLIDPSSGSVRVGAGRTVKDRLIAFVPQTPFVLRGTVAENIRWFRDIDDASVRRAAEESGLSGVLDRLPNGLESEVAQEGLTLSGGERQRLALARALAGSPRVLVMDEAMSALDSESEEMIQETLDALRGSVTILSVAHRLSTVMSADRVWVMESGRLIEDAPPTELLAQADSRFGRLGRLQGLGAITREE